MLIPPYRIALSGGGLKGIAHIGALEVLHEGGYLKSVREYIGISAGALVAFCLCIGVGLSELRMVISLLDFGLLRDINAETVLDFPETFGFDTGANLEKLLKTVLRAKRLSPDITFGELAALRLGPRLRIIAMNVNTCMPQEFNATVSPDMSVYIAVKGSMSIPIYFSPVLDPTTNQYLTDGGIYVASPFRFLTVEERRHTLAIAFNDTHKPRTEVTTLQEFLCQLYYCLDYKNVRDIATEWDDHIMYIKCMLVTPLQFETSQEEKIALMDSGRASAEEFLRQGSGRRPPPTRRFSFS